VGRDSFKLSFKTVNQADFKLNKSRKKAENKLKISSKHGFMMVDWAGSAAFSLLESGTKFTRAHTIEGSNLP